MLAAAGGNKLLEDTMTQLGVVIITMSITSILCYLLGCYLKRYPKAFQCQLLRNKSLFQVFERSNFDS